MRPTRQEQVHDLVQSVESFLNFAGVLLQVQLPDAAQQDLS